MEIACLYGAAVLLFIWGMYNFLGYRKEKSEIKKKHQNLFKKESGRSSFISKLGDRFDETQYASQLRKKLLYANITLLPSEFFAILSFCGFAMTMVLINIFSVPFTISLVISIGVCLTIYFLLFTIRRNKYFDSLNNQLSEICRMLGNSTKAGMTINQGIELVASEINAPAKEEFKELAQNLRLGVELERALRDLEKRIPTREYKLFISALIIQKRAGGNLTKVLIEMAQTLEERKILRQTVKTATAEQRFVSYILPAMPVFLLLMMNNMVDGFIDLIFTVPGAILTGLFVVGMLISILLVRAVTNIKV
jgi:tight adherence protein B